MGYIISFFLSFFGCDSFVIGYLPAIFSENCGCFIASGIGMVGRFPTL